MLFLQTHTFDIVRILSVLTVIGQALIVVAAIALLANIGKIKNNKLVAWMSKHGLVLLLVTALVATLGSLFFSEIAGWVPCRLCWFQRIFMYPQALLLIMALWRRDRKVAPYIFALCLFGIVFATFHYTEQLHALRPMQAANLFVPCDASGVSCASTQIFEFGYITIPMMALTAFVMNLLGSISMIWTDQKRS